MSKSTISTFQLFEMFPDAEAARVYMEGKRWPDGAVCPACDEAKRITTRKGGFYRCNACKTDFTVRTATIFERSHIPLHKWLYAMYLLVTARKGISSLQLAKQIGVTQKSAWFMLQRLREACGNDPSVLSGIVEIDEMYVGGKENRWALFSVGADYDGKNSCEVWRPAGDSYKGFQYPPRGLISPYFHVPDRDARFTNSLDDAVRFLRAVLPGWRLSLEIWPTAVSAKMAPPLNPKDRDDLYTPEMYGKDPAHVAVLAVLTALEAAGQ